MKRYMFIMSCKPGSEVEYEKRHKEVFPEMLEALQRNGFHNYSIFMEGNTLYAYVETNDLEAANKRMEAEPANTKWQSYMSDILEMDENGQPKMKLIQHEVFHLD
ncbi:L-rhamnose mutarotase [Aureibacillus halotolerans]|uniref:L-rhamnose mutarotase n=1 Tax=Aureibacillus halotolerans TaxID=1508390 RepID=A0A4R6U9Z7_9BACI|nr:L-rhamnose mutarotase [Aureibacillus halotolerans]TDQ42652.1 L-rhamnose mutarotase [Aureibacillus halotolerans]